MFWFCACCLTSWTHSRNSHINECSLHSRRPCFPQAVKMCSFTIGQQSNSTLPPAVTLLWHPNLIQVPYEYTLFCTFLNAPLAGFRFLCSVAFHCSACIIYSNSIYESSTLYSKKNMISKTKHNRKHTIKERKSPRKSRMGVDSLIRQAFQGLDSLMVVVFPDE